MFVDDYLIAQNGTPIIPNLGKEIPRVIAKNYKASQAISGAHAIPAHVKRFLRSGGDARPRRAVLSIAKPAQKAPKAAPAHPPITAIKKAKEPAQAVPTPQPFAWIQRSRFGT